MNPFSKIKALYKGQQEVLNLMREIEWAHIFHDSIRGNKPIEELALNIGRWAGNYSFFYVLNRILSEYKPAKILDLGLGESSKLISVYLNHLLANSSHVIVEHDLAWIDSFNARFSLTDRSTLIHCPLKKIQINGFDSFSYDRFEERVNERFDLYIVDGPFGSDRFSRYNIMSLVSQFDVHDEFIIIMDDTNRQGEGDTLEAIKEALRKKGILFFSDNYVGNKTNSLIVTKKYKNATSY